MQRDEICPQWDIVTEELPEVKGSSKKWSTVHEIINPLAHIPIFGHKPAMELPEVAAHPISKKCTGECKHCIYEGVFKNTSQNPMYKKGVWKKDGRRICVKMESLQIQNNKGSWFICDEKQIQKCHFYDPK
ncbi:MAG: hypothetical protein ABIG95_07210 [Candidatus Woesearchaeota archaeon]